MNVILAFLRLIRLPNLLIIAATQYLMRYCIIDPILELESKSINGWLVSQVSEVQFFLLCLTTVMIAAAGYIINDYFDLKIDRINKPKKVILDRYIKRRVAMAAHMVINILALGIAFVISLQMGLMVLISIHVFSAGALWFYSTEFKNQFLIGNVVISVLAALVPLIIGLYEVPLLNRHYADVTKDFGPLFNVIAFWIIGYTLFAFTLTLIREITKDVIDMKGDRALGCRTVPIVIGVKNTKFLLIFLYVVFYAGLLYVQQTFLKDLITTTFTGVVMGGLTAASSYFIVVAKTKRQFTWSSNLNKVIMIAGILYAFVARYFFLQ